MPNAHELLEQILVEFDYPAPGPAEWRQIKWPYDNDPRHQAWECWQYQDIILYPWPKGTWSYTIPSHGHKFDDGQSGSWYPQQITLEQAKAEIEKWLGASKG